MVADAGVFFGLWLQKPLQIAAVCPSSTRAAKAMARLVDLARPGPVLELGAGTGSLTRGLLRATESLKTNGVRVATRQGKPMRIDGPFAEAKELVGGFFLLDCNDEEQAIAIAGQCPAAEWATVEVRELGPCYT